MSKIGALENKIHSCCIKRGRKRTEGLSKMVLDDEDDDSRTLCGRNKKLG